MKKREDRVVGRSHRAVREAGSRIDGASQQPVWSWAWAVARLLQVMVLEICTVASGAGRYGGGGGAQQQERSAALLQWALRAEASLSGDGA